MLTYRNTTIVFVLLMVGLMITTFFTTIPWWIFLIIIFAYSLLLFYGSYVVSSNFYMPVVCKGDSTGKKLALSFDDGPVPGTTDRVLDILAEENIPAAFFCIGSRIKGNEELLKNIAAQGHIIGNHSYSHHFWFDLFPAKKMRQDIESANEMIAGCIGSTPAFFRPPYGVTTPVMHKVMQQVGCKAVGWNIRSMDTVMKEENKLLQKVVKALEPGAILLFHDTCDITIKILPKLIREAKQKGYEFTRLDELIRQKAYV